VLFDVGFGSFNFSWIIAERAFSQGLRPHIISSDLQQFNAIGPVFSLAHVMTAMMRLGMTLEEVVTGVTAAPAEALALSDRAGSLKPGGPADLSVFQIRDGEFTIADTLNRTRTADRRIVPIMAFRDGIRFDCDFTRGLDERNWFMQVIEDRLPDRAQLLTDAQRDFLLTLVRALSAIQWQLVSVQLDLDKAFELQGAFHVARRYHGLPLKDALRAVYDCFLERPFMTQIGLFLIRLDRGFALERLAAVAATRGRAAEGGAAGK
jgi:dihydroorotase